MLFYNVTKRGKALQAVNAVHFCLMLAGSTVLVFAHHNVKSIITPCESVLLQSSMLVLAFYLELAFYLMLAVFTYLLHHHLQKAIV